MVVWDSADPSISTSFVRVVAVCLNVPSTITEDTLGDLGASFGGMSLTCALFTIGVLVIWSVLPSVGEIGDSCIEYGAGDVRGYGGVVKDMWFESSVCIGTSQHAERVILIPLCVPVEPFEFCQVFGEVGHFLMGVMEALDFPS